MIHTDFGIKEILHSIVVLILYIVIFSIIYIIHLVTYERGSGHNVTKRKYRRIIRIMKGKIWIHKHLPRLTTFLGLDENFEHAEKYFSHHVL